jgi:5-methylcytosine-specific restriction endonuclease McrA
LRAAPSCARSPELKRGCSAEDTSTDRRGLQVRARSEDQEGSVILRVCAERGCNTLTRTGRCPRHPRLRARRNQRLRAAIAASVTTCPECGKAPTLDNPMTADHRLAQVHGGQDEPTNLRPLCRRCNGRLGAELVNGLSIASSPGRGRRLGGLAHRAAVLPAVTCVPPASPRFSHTRAGVVWVSGSARFTPPSISGSVHLVRNGQPYG